MILFIFGCAGSSLLRRLFSSCREQELLSSCGAGSSLQWLPCGAQASGTWASGMTACGLWLQLLGSRAQAQYCGKKP